MPSVRIRAPLKPGRRLLVIRIVLVSVSTKRSSSSNLQYSSTRACAITAPIRSRRPVIRAPRSRMAGNRPGSGSRAPSSKAVTTSARTIRCLPQ